MYKKIRNIILLICATILLLFLRINSKIIITNPIIHNLTLVLAYICYVLLLIKIVTLKNKFLKMFLATIFGFIALIGTIFVFFTCIDIVDMVFSRGKDYSFVCLNTIKHNNKEIKAYRTNGGATTSFGIIVREEERIIPGVINSNRLFDMCPLDTVLIELKDNKTLFIMDINHKTIKEINLDK